MENEEAINPEFIPDTSVLDENGNPVNPEAANDNNAFDAEDAIKDTIEDPVDAKVAHDLYEAAAKGDMDEAKFQKGLDLYEKYGEKMLGLYTVINRVYAKGLQMNPSFEAMNENWKNLAANEKLRRLFDAYKFTRSLQYGVERGLMVLRPMKRGASGAIQLAAYAGEKLTGKALTDPRILRPEDLLTCVNLGILETDDALLEEALFLFAQHEGAIEKAAVYAVNAGAKVRVPHCKTLQSMRAAGMKHEALQLQAQLMIREELKEERAVDARIEQYHDAEMEAANNVQAFPANNSDAFNTADSEEESATKRAA